jgi:hypothetical protein
VGQQLVGVDTIGRHKRLGCTVPEEFDQVSPQLVDHSGGLEVESGKNCGEGLLVQLVHHETDSSRSGVSDCGPAPVPGAGSAVWNDVLVLSVGPVGLVGAMIPSARFCLERRFVVSRRTANFGMTGGNHPSGEKSVPVVSGWSIGSGVTAGGSHTGAS